MALAQSHPTFTIEKYLEYEREGAERHEFLDGSVYAMAGESPRHSTICFNLYTSIGSQLRKNRNCRGYSPNMKVATNSKALFSYPDLTVVCGEPKYHDKKGNVLLNPSVIFEVLSPSTENYDRGEKVLRYTNNIESLTDYILVAQDKPAIEHFSKQSDGSWTKNEIEGINSRFYLPTIEAEIALAELYENVSF